MRHRPPDVLGPINPVIKHVIVVHTNEPSGNLFLWPPTPPPKVATQSRSDNPGPDIDPFSTSVMVGETASPLTKGLQLRITRVVERGTPRHGVIVAEPAR